jgi:DNA-binding PadR family transcriptional regulator
MKGKKRSIKEMVALGSPRLPKHEVEEIGDRVWKRLQTEMDKRDLSLRSLYGDGWNAPPLEQAEFQILTAASLLEEATPGNILREVDKWGGAGMLSLALDRLAAEGLLVSLETAGQPRRLQVTELGERALRRAKIEGKQLVNAREGFAEEKQSASAPEGALEGESPKRSRS